MEVSVRELKNQLSRYLRRAQAGQEITVTSHGRPVALLCSMHGRQAGEPDRTQDATAAALKRLRSQPWIRAGTGEGLKAPDKRIATPKNASLISELAMEDRR